MVAAVGIDAPQGGIIVAFRQAAHEEHVFQAAALAVYNVPAISLAATQANINVVIHEAATIAVPQARILPVVRGRAANPRVRAWTFTLDGHDFYVLRLGDSETLVYDLSTEQWTDWRSFGLPFWRLSTGISWIGGQALAHQYGSNIIAGDDAWGLLWFLDPLQAFDEHPDEGNAIQQIEFERIVTGQVVERGRDSVPCNVIFLTGDNYGVSVIDFIPAVTLEYSDDAGQTYVSAGTIMLADDQPYEWRSIGQIDSPGRLFRITDNGVFTRIDDMKMNDD